MIPQDLDDPAFRDTAPGALCDHSFQFPLESLQACYPTLDQSQLLTRYAVRGLAGLARRVGQAQEISDGR